MLLPRPISICEVSDDLEELRLVYRIAGKGTEAISGLKPGGKTEILGILGNGYEFDKIASVINTGPGNAPEISGEGNAPEIPGEGNASGMSGTEILLTLMDHRFLLLGGGIGIPPMLEAAKELKAHGAEPVIVAGYRDSSLFLAEDLEKYGTLYIATEDGSTGDAGNVLDVVRNRNLTADVIFACGPMPMLKAVAEYAAGETGKGHHTEAFLSLEERMACGVGACLGCVVKTKEKDPHSNVKNARICTEGPVFRASELDLE
ncbi:MAG: dihydroorotate dehydrogenase electron transfer subunit [Lachnospiraceae bacterium]|nr:dihydroorotate dehydrogenase electron transfer subunit [Lachnospiraceae bacterium]